MDALGEDAFVDAKGVEARLAAGAVRRAEEAAEAGRQLGERRTGRSWKTTPELATAFAVLALSYTQRRSDWPHSSHQSYRTYRTDKTDGTDIRRNPSHSPFTPSTRTPKPFKSMSSPLSFSPGPPRSRLTRTNAQKLAFSPCMS